MFLEQINPPIVKGFVRVCKPNLKLYFDVLANICEICGSYIFEENKFAEVITYEAYKKCIKCGEEALFGGAEDYCLQCYHDIYAKKSLWQRIKERFK